MGQIVSPDIGSPLRGPDPMLPDVVETLCDLVRIPSVNPMGRRLDGPEYLEYALTDHLERFFRKLGVPWVRQEVEPRRANILAGIVGSPPPAAGGEVLVFEAHQDTVPVDGMRIAPWSPVVQDERVYGRGACDVKGGMACMLTAFARLARERPVGMPTLVMACSVNEEHGFTGAHQMAQLWAAGECDFIPRVPDGVLVAEPTELDVVVTHKGVARWRCRTRGRAAHSARPETGHNAIFDMARVLLALEDYATDTVLTLGQHPLLGRPTLSVGVITGGISVNTVPDACVVEIDRRLLPEEDGWQAREHVIRYIAARCPGAQMEHEPPFLLTPGFSDQHNAGLARRVGFLAQACGAPGRQIGVPYGTDAPAFEQAGAPTVVFGPGALAQAHTDDEWISIEQLRMATEIYYRLGREGLCG
jgi:acetylornithine deacetylase